MQFLPLKKPIYHLELVFLLTKSIDVDNTFENEQKIERLVPGYFEAYQRLLEQAHSIIKRYPKIVQIHEEEPLGVFTKVMYQIESLEFEDLSLKAFVKASITKMVLQYSESDLKDQEKIKTQIDDLYGSNEINFSLLFNFVHQLEIDADKKYRHLEYYNDIDFIYEQLMNLFAELRLAYDEFYETFLDAVNGFYDYFKNKRIDDLPIDQWIDLESFEKLTGVNEVIYFTSSLINYNGISAKFAVLDQQKSMILYGIFYDLFAEDKESGEISVETIQAQMNALGNKKRLEIFSLLLTKEYYLKELAEALNLTSATISHHIDILSSAGLIKLRSKGTRIYYSLNSKLTQELSDYFQKVTDHLGG